MLSLCWAKNGVFLLEAKRNTPFWGHVGAMLGPCWAYVGPCWAYVGPMLGQERRVHLGPSTLFLGHVGAMLGPKTMVFATFGIKKHGIYSVFAYHHAKTLVFNGIYAFFRLLQQGSSLSLSLLPSLSLSLSLSLALTPYLFLSSRSSCSCPLPLLLPLSLSLFLSPPLPRPYSLSFSFLSLLLPSTSSPPPPLPRYDVELAVNKVFLEKSYKVPGVCVCLPSTPSSLSLWPSLSLSFSLSLFSASPIQAGPGSRVAGAAHTQQGCQFLYGPNQGAPCSIDSEGAHGFGPMLGVVVNCQETHTRSIRVEHRGTFHTQF